MEIRKASQSDWGQIKDLYLSLLKSDPDAFVEEYQDIRNRGEEKWVDGLNNKTGAIFVADVDGKLVGMGRINFYENLPKVPVLHKLGVLPEYRGQGIAKKLVSARESWAIDNGANKVRLYVIEDRNKTIEFSKNNGYQIVQNIKASSHRKDGTPINVVVMEKELLK